MINFSYYSVLNQYYIGKYYVKNSKNIRKLYNAKLLFVSSDDKIGEVIGKEIDDYFKELKVVSDLKEAISLACSNNYDVAIIDADIVGVSFSQLCTELLQLTPTLPKIVISDSDNNENIVTAINSGAYTFYQNL